jgi:hypothetical protein
LTSIQDRARSVHSARLDSAPARLVVTIADAGSDEKPSTGRWFSLRAYPTSCQRAKLCCRMVESDYDAFFGPLKHGDSVALRDLIEQGRDVNARNEFGWTPLMWARGNTACISILLEAGADVNAVNQVGETALACEAQKGHVAAVILLLGAGARVNVRPHGGSLLAYVMTGEGRNHPRIFELLRNAGATE